MKVVLRSDVKGVGKRGDIVAVADGYGRNFLLPKGFAIPASDGIVRQAESMRRARDYKDQKDKESAQAVASRIVEVVLQIQAKAGKGGKLFGSVTANDIIDALQVQTGIELDRRKLHLDEPIKQVGEYQVPVKLHADVEVHLPVMVSESAE